MSVELRDAHEGDMDSCTALLAALRDSTEAGAAVPSTLNRAIFSNLVNKQRGQITIAEEDGVILGMATVSYNLALRYNGEYCQLEELVVTPAARGKKLGGLLVQRIIDNARARGCTEIGLYLLESTAHNQPFYEKYGFVALGAEMRQSLA